MTAELTFYMVFGIVCKDMDLLLEYLATVSRRLACCSRFIRSKRIRSQRQQHGSDIPVDVSLISG